MVTQFITPNPLQPGHYRFQTLARLTGRAGNSVTPFTRDFFIANLAASRLENDTGNDTLPGATPLPMTETPAGSGFFTSLGVGSIATPSDVDYWRFDAEAGDHITVVVEADGSDPTVQLRNAADSNLATNPQDFTIPSPGTYYLRVSNGSSVHYQMRVDQARGPQLEVEANNAQAQATLLNLSGTGGTAQARVAGAIPASDTSGDFYRLNTINTGNTITVSLDLPSFGTLNPGNVLITIQQQGSSTPSCPARPARSATVAADNTYYVRVVGWRTAPASAHLLTVRSSTPSPR